MSWDWDNPENQQPQAVRYPGSPKQGRLQKGLSRLISSGRSIWIAVLILVLFIWFFKRLHLVDVSIFK